MEGEAMKQKTYLLLLALCGAVVGLGIYAQLLAIAVPKYNSLLLPLAQLDSMRPYADFAQFFSQADWVIKGLLLVGAVLTWILVLRQVSPAWARSTPRKQTNLFWAGWLLSAGFILIVYVADQMGLNFGNGDYLFFVIMVILYFSTVFLLSSKDLETKNEKKQPRFFLPFVLLLLWIIVFPFGMAFLDKWNDPLIAVVPYLLFWGSSFPIYVLRRGLKKGGAFSNREKLKQLAWTVLGGALFGAFLAALFWVMDQLFEFFFEWVVAVGQGSAESNLKGAWMLMAVLVGLMALFFIIGFGLAPSFRGDGTTMKKRFRQARAPLAILGSAALLLGVFYLFVCLKCDWRAGGLAQIAGLPDQGKPADQTLVAFVLEKGKPDTSISSWKMQLDTWGLGDDSKEIPATEGNAQAMEKFLESGNHLSRYYFSTIDNLPRIYGVLWEPERAFGQPSEFAQGSYLHTILSAMWVCFSAPVTDSNRRLLEQFSDPAQYSIPEKWTLKLAKGWHRFGDAQKAGYWLQKARSSSDPTVSEEAKRLDWGTSPVLVSGKVMGRVTLVGAAPGTRLKVGLFYAGSGSEMEASKPSGSYSYRMTGAQEIISGGAFTFDHLSEGNYYLCLLIPSEVHKAPRHPGIIRLSTKHPSGSFGDIRITP